MFPAGMPVSFWSGIAAGCGLLASRFVAADAEIHVSAARAGVECFSVEWTGSGENSGLNTDPIAFQADELVVFHFV